ncbi:hypothetical protein [Nocardia flavorosea]|uniref:hypothetical protein n=1 Tax=Nocardia flavorosea TaxID=53429 RepID=UPI0024581E4C|nr:hypothetical protein [Nocardia flavorosea]
MSRGNGKTQRQILATLEAEGREVSAVKLGRIVFGPDVTRDQHTTIRRAIKRLAETRQARAVYRSGRLFAAPLDIRTVPTMRGHLPTNGRPFRPRWAG